MKSLVFTEQSLYKCIYYNLYEEVMIFNIDRHDVFSVIIDESAYILSTGIKDKNFRNEGLIVLNLEKINLASLNSFDKLQNFFIRIHRISNQSKRKNSSIPHAWASYHSNNKIALFAYPEYLGKQRIILEVNVNNTNDIYVHELDKGKSRIILEDYVCDYKNYEDAIFNIDEVQSKASEICCNKDTDDSSDLFNLNFTYFDDETFAYTFDDWSKKLTHLQKQFIFSDETQSIKLKGPAGTGKTLSLEMKAAKILLERENIRVLYLTHSWTVANQVQIFLEKIISDNQRIKNIDVFPLLTIAELNIKHSNVVKVLGEDSYSGKLLQIKQLKIIIEDFKRSDWILLRENCCEDFIERIESSDDIIKNTLVWDLMLEFACVISANGILPSITAKEKYESIERKPYMMRLLAKNDRLSVLTLYTSYINKLMADMEITSDQLVNDFLSYLSTYRWLYDRKEKGYDYIFIDEMQLFNEQERMVFHYLTRYPDKYPILFMAIDPKQTIMETYFDYQVDIPGNTSESNIKSESTYGEIRNISITDIFRYSPEILNLLKHIDKTYPALELNEEWNNNINISQSRRKNNKKPVLYLVDNPELEIRKAILIAEKEISQGFKTAILSINLSQFADLKEQIKDNHLKYEVIESRDDTMKLQYLKKSIVISQPYYVIGLQFDSVIIIGCKTTFNETDPNQNYNLRRYISDIYLGASRASERLYLLTDRSGKSAPRFLEDAVKKSLIDMGEQT